MLKVLHYVAVDKEAREELDKEEYYIKAMEGMFGEKDRKLAEYKVKLEEKDKELSDKDRKIEELQRQIEKLNSK